MQKCNQKYNNLCSQIIEFYKAGEKEQSSFKLGVEIEHFVLDKNNHSVFYEEHDRPGVKDILFELSSYYDKKIFSDAHKHNPKNIVGLERKDCAVSIEPGAQLEVSISPYFELEKIQIAYQKFRLEVDHICKKFDYKLVELGYRPDKCALEVPLIPRARYMCMDAHFKTMDTMGPCMMRGSASTQISIDYHDEQDCIKKLFVANALSPLIYFLYDNSPIFEKQHVGHNKTSLSNKCVPDQMVRGVIWKHTDIDRCGITPGVFANKDFSGYKDIASSYCNMPLIFAPKEYKNLYNKNLSYSILGDSFYGPHTCCEIIKDCATLTPEEIAHVISMSFYDVRVKNFIEIRCADSLSIEYAMSFVAFIKAIFYDEHTFDNVFELFKDIKDVDIKLAFSELYNKKWSAIIYKHKTTQLFNKLLSLAKQGIKTLAPEETHYLKPTEKLIQNQTSARDTIDHSQNIISNINEEKFIPASDTITATKTQSDFYTENNSCYKDRINYMQKHLCSNAKYNGTRRRIGYLGKFFHNQDILQFVDIVATTDKILNKVADKYFEDEQFQKLWQFSTWEKSLVNKRSDYKNIIPISRFDIFYNEHTCEFEFCEFNTGGTSGMNESNEMDKTGLESAAVKYVQKSTDKTYKRITKIEQWTKDFINIYNKWAADNNCLHTSPTFAIVDFLDNCSIEEFACFKQQFEKHGINALIADIRDLDFKDGKLTYKGEDIDAIYKRVTLDDLYAKKDEIGTKNLIDAVMSESVLSVDWFDSQIIHGKQICSILFHENTQAILTESENRFIQLHQPWSAFLDKNIASNEDVIKNKNEYIIKPISAHSGNGVTAGLDLDTQQWNKTLQKCSKGGFIIQKYAAQYMSHNVMIDHDNRKNSCKEDGMDLLQKYSNMEGLYSFLGKFNGIFMRQAPGTINIATTGNLDCPVYFETNDGDGFAK